MSHPPPPPPPPASSPPLPAGWSVLYDPSGRPYYHDAASNTTQWTPPQPPPPPPDQPPPQHASSFQQPSFQPAPQQTASFPHPAAQPAYPGGYPPSQYPSAYPPSSQPYASGPPQAAHQQPPLPQASHQPASQPYASPPVSAHASPPPQGYAHAPAHATTPAVSQAYPPGGQPASQAYPPGGPPASQPYPPGGPPASQAYPPGGPPASPPYPPRGPRGAYGDPGQGYIQHNNSYSAPPSFTHPNAQPMDYPPNPNAQYPPDPNAHYPPDPNALYAPNQQPHQQPPQQFHQPPPYQQPLHQPPPPHHQPSMASSAPPMSTMGLEHQMAHMSVAPGPVYPPQGHPVQGGSPGMAMTSVSVSLEFSAEGLKNKDLLGKSDPLVRLLVPKHPTLSAGAVGKHEWREVARTEVIANCTDPVWARRLKISYHFEQLQPLRFALVDVDNNTKGTGDSLGIADVTLGEIVRSGNLRLKLVSESGRDGKYGILTVRAHDDNAAGRVRVKLSFGGRNLDKKDTFGKSDPYFVLSRAEQGRMSVVHKSKHIMNNLNPDWPPHTAILYTSGMTWDQILMKCVVYDWDKYTPHDLIGEANFSLLQLSRGGSMPLINPAKKGKRKYRDSGTLQIHRADAVELPSFVSFLQGGMKLNFVVAVDFTASNRPPDNPQSLHYMGNPDRPSQYWQALNAVGRVLEGYIPDGYMTALGFGGILPGMGDTPSFDFALTGQPDPRVRGVGGLLEAYETAIRNVRLAGPTNFEPLLRNAMSLCDTNPVSQRNQHFSVVLILTDGIITDLENTIEAIIDASYTTPMAIVIVGIGTQNFSVMERLDGDKHKLKSNNGQREAKHDIVQFVKYAPERGIDVFAAEVLQEIPERIVEFMVDAGIKPGVHL